MPVKHTIVKAQNLIKFSTEVLEKVGLSTDDAAVTANLLVNTVIYRKNRTDIPQHRQ